MLCQVMGFPFVSACTRPHCPFIAPKSSESIGGFRYTEWAMDTRVYTLSKLRDLNSGVARTFPVGGTESLGFHFISYHLFPQ